MTRKRVHRCGVVLVAPSTLTVERLESWWTVTDCPRKWNG